MNKQEYTEMRQEFAQLIYEYELYLKRGFLTDCRYNVIYYDTLRELRTYEAELAIMSQAIQSKSKHKIEDILNAITRAKEEFKKETETTVNKHTYCQQLLQIIDRFDKSVFELSETKFKDFVVNYHPVVCLNSNPEAKKAYDMLKRFYLESNYIGFDDYLKKNMNIFDVGDLNDDKYVEASQVYYNFRNTINNSMKNLEKQYPYNKMSVFNDDMTVLAEKDDLEIRAKKISESIKNAKKDFFDNFGFEFSLTD